MGGGCVFCDYQGPSPVRTRVRGCYVIEPLRPVVEGHLLVVPEAHARDALAAPSLFGAVAWAAADYADSTGHRDWNLISSAGRAASQTVGHLHLHLVPRRPGDGLKLPWTSR